MDLTPERALIFRITHVSNVPWILDHGVHCASSDVRDPNFRPIGSADLIAKRARREVPVSPGGTIEDYVAFYFSPSSPMLYNIKTGVEGVTRRPMSEIAVLVSSLHRLKEQGVQFLFTDRHAYFPWAKFSSDLADLVRIRWPILQARNFARDPDDPDKFEQYQAEALAHRLVPVTALLAIACQGDVECGRIRDEVARRGLGVKVVARPGWYFS